MTRLEWLAWRKLGIGSSDAPIIMGNSPWKTPLQLFEEKISTEVKDEEPNYIQNKGIQLEPKVRSLFELSQARSFAPALCESADFPFLKASLDGRSEDKSTIIEIKMSGKEDWEASIHKGIVPEKYYPQIQHQLMVSGADACFYLSYNDDGQGIRASQLAIIPVQSNRDYQGHLLKAEIEFWDCVVAKKPPMPSDRDYKTIKGMAAIGNKFKKLSQKMKQLEIELDTEKEKILEAAKTSGHPRVMIGGLKVAQISRIGNVDYKKIPQLAGVNLDQYRGKGSLYWKIDF